MTRPMTLTVRTPEDVLALVPYVLGFLPEDSVVLMTTTGDSGAPFHARTDLPRDPDGLDAVADLLADAALRNHAHTAIAVLYTDDVCLALEMLSRLRARLVEAGIEVPLALRVHAGCYTFPDDPDSVPVSCDVEDHPLTAQAVYDGRVTYRSRQELSDSLVTADPDAVERMAELCDGMTEQVARADRDFLGSEARWARATVREAVTEASVLDDGDAARLLAALTSAELRDVLWADIDQAHARSQVAFWSDVVRRCPLDLLAPPAALLGFAAWMAGDGALSWCALDRCREADPGYSMAELLASMLQAATPPSHWRPIDPASLSLLAG